MPEERRFLRGFGHKLRRHISGSSGHARSTHGSDQQHDQEQEQLPPTASGPAHPTPPLLHPPQPSSAPPNRPTAQDPQLSPAQQPQREEDKPELFAEENPLSPQQLSSRRASASSNSLQPPDDQPETPEARGRKARTPASTGDRPGELPSLQTPSNTLLGQLADDPPSPRSHSYLTEDFVNQAAQSLLASESQTFHYPSIPKTATFDPSTHPFSSLKTVPEDTHASDSSANSSVQPTAPETSSAIAQNTSRSVPLAKSQSQRQASNAFSQDHGSASSIGRPSAPPRRQSLISHRDRGVTNALMNTTANPSEPQPPLERAMVHRNVWVKRPSSSPTQINVSEGDLVDDLRSHILKRYANSLGRTLDPPDIQIRVYPRDNSPRRGQDRILGEEEYVGDTVRDYYPGGQDVSEALVIEIPPRRTPRPSPRQVVSYAPPPPSDDHHYVPEQTEYFPPMSVIQGGHAHGHPPYEGSHSAQHSTSSLSGSHQVHSMSVINTGQVPNIPSPGSRGSWHQQQHQPRPRYSRQHTSSPTTHPTSPSPNRSDTTAAPLNGAASVPSPPAVSTPPIPAPEPAARPAQTPPIRVSSPRPSQQKPRKPKKAINNGNANNNSSNNNKIHNKIQDTTSPGSTLSPMASVRDETIPPVNVLIVEDNIINLKLLEAFMMRISVPYQVAMNGRDAVNKWRNGGFHIVLMDIQLPILNGLDATKEIRRLERVNNIGVFSKTVSSSASSPIGRGNSPFESSALSPEDVLNKGSKFKSPVIIVALTASSLQSDRHEALAAGCNDFLTKPVNMMWLGQKVKEWGCMQALIDFEGWRKWRGYADSEGQSLQPAIIVQQIASPPGPQPIASVLKG